MDGGYPAEANIDVFLNALGIELITENNPNFILEDKQLRWNLVSRLRWALALSVYCPSPTTFNVTGGYYVFNGDLKTFTPAAAIDPVDNDTTYIWLTSSNTIGYGIDANGWPAAEHIKLAEVDVDVDGMITDVRDLRGQEFLHNLAPGKTDWAEALCVYRASDTTVNVTGGYYTFKGVLKTFTPGSAIDPADSDTTYVWLTSSNTIGSGIDGSGWPAADHIKLAEIDVDAAGVITDIRDLRGREFLRNFAPGKTDWAEALCVYRASDTTVNVIGGDYRFNGQLKSYTPAAAIDPVDNDTTYIWITSSNTIGSGIDGSGWPAADHIKLAEVDVDAAGVITDIRDQRGREFLQHKTSSHNLADSDASAGAVPFILQAAIAAGATVAIHNADAPFKYRVIDAWSIATSADGGTWKITDGTNDITDTVTVAASDKDIDRVGTVDDAYNEIAASGSLSVVGDGATLDAIVYINCIRIL